MAKPKPNIHARRKMIIAGDFRTLKWDILEELLLLCLSDAYGDETLSLSDLNFEVLCLLVSTS